MQNAKFIQFARDPPSSPVPAASGRVAFGEVEDEGKCRETHAGKLSGNVWTWMKSGERHNKISKTQCGEKKQTKKVDSSAYSTRLH